MLAQHRRQVARKLAHGAYLKRIGQQMEEVDRFVGNEMEDYEDADNYPSIPLEMIGMLGPQQRKRLQAEFSHMPAYLFMSQWQKRKYFEGKDDEYKNIMESIDEKKSQQKVKFKTQFEVRPFKREAKVYKVKEVQTFNEKYNPNIHYST